MLRKKTLLNGYITEIAIGKLFFYQSQVAIGKKSVYQSYGHYEDFRRGDGKLTSVESVYLAWPVVGCQLRYCSPRVFLFFGVFSLLLFDSVLQDLLFLDRQWLITCYFLTMRVKY